MKNDRAKGFVLILYLVVVVIMAGIYFSVPERAVLLSNAIDWWAQILDMLL